MPYWLMKSEPAVYSIDDLSRDGQTFWEGVRNYQARNFMRDDMKVGDLVLFYHSNAERKEEIGVAGVARICCAAYPDPTAWDATNPYYDAKCPVGEPRWLRVDVEFISRLPVFVTLEILKAAPALEGMLVVKKGMRLSVQPVTAEHFAEVLRLGGK